MFDTKWNPQKSRVTLTTRIPDALSVGRAKSFYYITIGALASITQTAIKDLLDDLKREGLYRQNLKRQINEAFKRSCALINIFKKYTQETGQYQLWLDVTDSMEEQLKKDVTVLFYTTDNIMLKNNKENHRVQTMTVVAYNLCVMLHDMSIRYDEVMHDVGIFVPGLKPNKEFTDVMYGIYSSMREVADIVVKDKGSEFLKEDGMIYRALETIAMKVVDFQRAEQASVDGMAVNGIDSTGENPQDNSYMPWNDVQDNFIVSMSELLTIEEIAKRLGRSVGAVKTRMRRLKIKVKPLHI